MNKFKWIKPVNDEEHDEVITQSKNKFGNNFDNILKTLKNKRKYSESLNNSKTEFYNRLKFKNVSNTEAGKTSFNKMRKTLDPNKLKRVTEQRVQEKMPIVLRDRSSNQEHLLAGNTRALYHTRFRKKIPVSVLEF